MKKKQPKNQATPELLAKLREELDGVHSRYIADCEKKFFGSCARAKKLCDKIVAIEQQRAENAEAKFRSGEWRTPRLFEQVSSPDGAQIRYIEKYIHDLRDQFAYSPWLMCHEDGRPLDLKVKIWEQAKAFNSEALRLAQEFRPGCIRSVPGMLDEIARQTALAYYAPSAEERGAARKWLVTVCQPWTLDSSRPKVTDGQSQELQLLRHTGFRRCPRLAQDREARAKPDVFRH